MDWFRDDIKDIIDGMDLKHIVIMRELGWTGYMEGMVQDDLPSNINIGYDKYNRFFLAIKLTNGEVIVVFKRYSDPSSSIIVNNGMRKMNAVVGDEHWNIIKELLTTGSYAPMGLTIGKDMVVRGIRRPMGLSDILLSTND